MIRSSDVFSAAVVVDILSENERSVIVAINNRGVFLNTIEVFEEFAKPDRLTCGIAESKVFGFHSRISDNALTLAAPADGAVAEVEDVSRSGSTGIRAVLERSVGVTVEHWLPSSKSSECQREIQSPLQVLDHAFNSLPVLLAGVTAETTEFSNGVGEVRSSSKHKVHETTDRLQVGNPRHLRVFIRVREGAVVHGELMVRGDGRVFRVAVKHRESLKDSSGEFPLIASYGSVRSIVLPFDSKVEVEFAEVFDFEMRFDKALDFVHLRTTVSCDSHVVDVSEQDDDIFTKMTNVDREVG